MGTKGIRFFPGWKDIIFVLRAYDYIDPATKQKVTVEVKKIYTGYSAKKGFKGEYSYTIRCRAIIQMPSKRLEGLL